MRKKIVIFGHYGVPNWGDEAILAGMLSQINIANFLKLIYQIVNGQTML
jgi:polysaccharide pyruvyl transferase WcaK-like protein